MAPSTVQISSGGPAGDDMGNHGPAEDRRNNAPEANPEVEGKRKKSGARNWTSHIIATLALLVSLISAYFTVVRRIDALSVFVPIYPPLVFIDDKSGHLEVTNLDQNLTYINSGTGSVAVMLEGITINDGDADAVCSNQPVAVQLYQIEPIVIKPGEIRVHDVKNDSGKSDRKRTVEKSDFGLKAGQIITVCLFLSVVTSANVAETVRLPLYSTKLALASIPFSDFSKSVWSVHDLSKPLTVIYHYGTIFY
jgi:hypothetical protein